MEEWASLCEENKDDPKKEYHTASLKEVKGFGYQKIQGASSRGGGGGMFGFLGMGGGRFGR